MGTDLSTHITGGPPRFGTIARFVLRTLPLAVAVLAPCSLSGDPTTAPATDPRKRLDTLARLADEHPWFRKQKAAIVEKCDQRMGQSDEALWCTMPAQCIPRSNTVNREHGCPNCGDAIHRGYGYYPWRLSGANPWKVHTRQDLGPHLGELSGQAVAEDL